MTAVAQALEFTAEEEANVSPVRDNMVSIRCRRPPPIPGADPTEGLCKQLITPPLCPAISGIRVQVMPGNRIFSKLLGLMLRAVSCIRQHSAAWMLAFTQWLQHVDLLSGQIKKPAPSTALAIHGTGSRHRHSGNIHDQLSAAALAFYRQILRCRLRQQVGNHAPPAYRAQGFFPCCRYFITRGRNMQ